MIDYRELYKSVRSHKWNLLRIWEDRKYLNMIPTSREEYEKWDYENNSVVFWGNASVLGLAGSALTAFLSNNPVVGSLIFGLDIFIYHKVQGVSSRRESVKADYYTRDNKTLGSKVDSLESRLSNLEDKFDSGLINLANNLTNMRVDMNHISIYDRMKNGEVIDLTSLVNNNYLKKS